MKNFNNLIRIEIIDITKLFVILYKKMSLKSFIGIVRETDFFSREK
jgi:hypothetical protein